MLINDYNMIQFSINNFIFLIFVKFKYNFYFYI